HPHGLLGPLVRAAHREWDLGIIRSAAVLAGLAVALAAAATWRFRSWPRWAGVALAAFVCALLLVPAVLLQVGLRDATDPWYHTNDSTYQIELAGDLVLHGHNPYGHDYPGPLEWRLAIGSVLAANPILVRGAWFGTADAPSLLALMLAFGLLSRGRFVWAAASLGAAVALKQFALVALPFFAVMLLTMRVP